jgi:hypothetical protein
LDVLENGEESWEGVRKWREVRKKKSREKKSRRKYRKLEDEKEGKNDVAAAAEGEES